MKDFERVEIRSREALHRWLRDHHAQADSVWIVTWKKAEGAHHVPVDAIVDEALAFGWIDSQPRVLDAQRSMRLLSPRRPGSAWSRVNKARIERLTTEGRMQPAGLRVVEAARADGSWSRLDPVETLVPPEDLRAALAADAQAQGHWDAFPPSTRRAILEWIGTARTAATRDKRIAETVSQAHENLRANQYRQPKSAGVKAR